MEYTYKIIHDESKGMNNSSQPFDYISILYTYKGKTIETTCNLDYPEIIAGRCRTCYVTDKNIKLVVLQNIKADINCCKYWGLI